MKTRTKLIGVVAIAMALILSIAFSGVALASQPVKPTKQTETIDITTTITCSGTVVESQRLDLESSSMNLLDNPPLKYPTDTKHSKVGNTTYDKKIGEVYGKIKYDEKMIGSSGTTEFDKCLGVDTGSAPNLDVHKQIGYTQGALGSLSYDEQVGMKAVAAGSYTKKTSTIGWPALEPWKQYLCPFRDEKKEYKTIPASCEEVNVYSEMVVTDVQATTETSVGITAAPVSLNYKIDANGSGLVVAGVDVYVGDGRGYGAALGSRLMYKEKSIAYGDFEFTKKIGYESKLP
jgi:hypothetical protein